MRSSPGAAGGPEETSAGLVSVYGTLLEHYGHQNWWPARTRMEMVAGALLVQNTRWTNAARAIAALRRKGWLRPEALAEAPLDGLSDAVRPAGFWRSKAPRLRGVARWLVDSGGFGRLARLETGALRGRLLTLHGVGPETADCILVYAFRRPVFIADGYARRLLQRVGLLEAAGVAPSYEPVRRWAEAALPSDAGIMNEFHALIVAHGKSLCGLRPACRDCPVRGRCATGRQVTGRRSSGR